MPDEHAYWEWRDALLMHPEGRAVGGEPCVKCGEPIPASAHWKNRDRHVCSPRCNLNLGRQFNRRAAKVGAEFDLHGRVLGSPDRLANPRTSGPRVFLTREGQDPPMEWEGFGVRPGDVVERYGVFVSYALMSRETEEAWPDWWPDHAMIAEELTSGHLSICGATAEGDLTRLHIGYFDSHREMLSSATFVDEGVAIRWYRETISDVTADGREFDWVALVAAPVESPYSAGWWSPARTALSEKRKRESTTLARHTRRMRLQDATIERFDPESIYDRDGWVCQLCGLPVDRTLVWPDPASKSLDHIVPLVAGGAHSRLNTQLAHWICNVRKGARF